MSDINVGSVSVDVVPDMRGFSERVRAGLADLSVDVAVNLDTTAARAQLDELARPRDVTLNADADTSAAEARLDAAARPRDAKIHADVGNISTLAASVVALGPALVPIVAAVSGLALTLGAPIAAAGGGLTIFGLLAGKEISKTQKVAKQIDDLKKRATTLVDPKARADAAAQAKALEETLTGPQRAFLAAKDAVSGAFDSLMKTSGKALFAPIVAGMQLLGNLMPQLAPIISSVSGALAGMIRDLGDSAKSGGLKDFLSFIGQMAGPTLTTAASILGNVAKGFGGLFRAFAPLSGALAGKLLQLSGAFANFGSGAGSNKGFQSFVAYVQQVGPQVAQVFGQIVGALGHLAAALAPLGPIVLGGIGLLARVISAIPTPVLTVLAAVIGTVVLALKAWSIIQAVLDAELWANPIGVVVLAIVALVAGLIAAYKSSQTFRDIVNGAFHAVAAAIDFAKEHWRLLITLILGPFGAAIVFIVDHFNTVKDVCRTVFKFIVDAFLTVVGAIVNGAARAFGWVPGIGGKLKAAADKFNEFRDSVNAALDGIHSVKDIHLNVTTRQSVLVSSINKPRVPMGATGAIVNRPTLAIIGEAGPEAVVPLDRTAGNSPLPKGGSTVDLEQSTYRAMRRVFSESGAVVMQKADLDALDLVGVA